MNMDKTFQQIWDYRRKDDDVDSMSDDSKSSSGDEASGRKHMLVHVLSSPEQDEAATDHLSQSSQQNYSKVHFTNGGPFRVAKGKKQIQPSGKKRNGGGGGRGDKKKNPKPNHGVKRKRKEVNESTPDQNLAIFSDFKTFTDSLLEELKVARKKMLVQMGKQIAKLASPKKPVSKPRKRKSKAVQQQSGSKPGGGKNQSSNKKGLSKGETQSNGKRKIAAGKQKSGSVAAVKKPLDVPNASDQIDSSFCGNSRTNAANSSTAAEIDTSLADRNEHYNHLLGIQPAENWGSFDQITSSKEVVVYMQQQSSQTTSRTLSVLPVPFHHHQWSGNNDGFNHLSSQSAQENYKSTANVRMNDDGSVMGFAGRSHMF